MRGFDPRPTIADAVDAVRTGDADAAMVPLENCDRGLGDLTLDELAFGAGRAVVRREVLLPITIALLARSGVGLDEVSAVLSMPHAAAQCRRWLAANLPGVPVARDHVDRGGGPAGRACRTSRWPRSARRSRRRSTGSTCSSTDVGDNPDAMTRFVLVGRARQPPPAPTGADRTSASSSSSRDDHPGALLELLEEFAVRGVNLTRIESRPTGAGLGRYCFFVDIEGHVADAARRRGADRAQAQLRRRPLPRLVPARDRPPSPAARGTTESDFASAARWLAQIRGDSS